MSKDPQEVIMTPEELEKLVDDLALDRVENHVLEIAGNCQNAEYGFPVIIGAVMMVGRPAD